ncbi:MAG TPA: hypothetical protein VFZ32_02540 [Micromonosporaceae bacterium]
MNPLEHRYRILLALYPADHRAIYQEEMIGVLMEGTSPGQRYPRPREAVNLVSAALWRRLGGTAGYLTDPRWAPAAAVFGLLGSLLMLVAGSYSILEYAFLNQWMIPEGAGPGYHPGYGAEFWYAVLPVAAWVVPIVATVVGWRLLAATVALGLVAWDGVWFAWVVGKSAAITPPYSLVWLTLGITTVAALWVPTARQSVRRQLGWRRIGLLVGAAGLLAATSYLEYLQGNYKVIPVAGIRFSAWSLPLAVVAVGFIGYVVFRLEAGTRRRVLALVAPTLVLLIVIGYDVFGINQGWRLQPSIADISGEDMGVRGWGEVVTLLAVPLVTFAIAVVAVRQREHTLRLVELGRERERKAAADPPREDGVPPS